MEKGFFAILALCIVYANSIFAQEVKSVNFIQEGEVSKLIIDFDKDVFAERKHIPEDKQIILDIKNVQAKDKFLRGIDTSEFSGSAVLVSAYRKPGSKNDLRFAIQLRDNVRSILEMKNKRLILSIENRFGVFTKKKIEKSESLSQNVSLDSSSDVKILIPKSNSVQDILENLTLSGIKKYIGKKISINVNSVPYQDILRMIADTSGFNIIIDDEINKLQPLTLSLTNIPWDQALDTILDLGKLVAEKHSNILSIKTAKKAREQLIEEMKNKNDSVEQEPLVTKIFPLSFSKRESMTTIIKDYLTPKRGSIQSDERTNNLIVRDTVEVIERIKKIIDTLDTQTPQVLIESKIVEAFEDYELNLGLSNGLLFNENPGNVQSGSFSFNSAPNTSTPGVGNAIVSIVKDVSTLSFNLNLMESESKGRIISSPKVITLNNQQAQISTVTTQRFFTDTISQNGVTTRQIQEVPINISLNVTPQVTNEGSISLNVNMSKSGVTSEISGQPPITTSRNIATNVLINNGSTLVIGGLYQTENRILDNGIPILKDLPIIGWLFRNSYNPKNSRNELMVFLTPRIVNQEEAGLTTSELDEVGI